MAPSLGLLRSPLPPSSLVFSQIPPLAPVGSLSPSPRSCLMYIHPYQAIPSTCAVFATPGAGFPPPAGLPRVGASHAPPPSLHPVLLFSVFLSHLTTCPHGSLPCRHLSTVLLYFFLPQHPHCQAPGLVPTGTRRGYFRRSCEAGPQALASSRSPCPSLSGWAALFFPTWGSVTLLQWVPTASPKQRRTSFACYSRSFAV